MENHKVDQFFISTDGAFNAFSVNVILDSPEARVEAANDYYKDVLSKFIVVHEEHLEKNGSNGHYVGNSITLADIKTAQFIDRVFFYVPKGADKVPISAEKTPNLWKLYESVNNIPSLTTYKNSQRFQELSVGTRAFFKWQE